MASRPWTAGRALALLAMATAAHGAEPGWADVSVRLYHGGTLAEADEGRATDAAAAILTAAAVRLQWAHCHAGAPSDPRCARPSEPGELIVRLVRTGRLPQSAAAAGPESRAQRAAPRALGEALVAARGSAPPLATVHLDRVEQLARHSGTDAAVLLGRALAHELTHLLTGSGRHARTGLMRPVWSAAELARNHAGDWTLDEVDVGAIRARATLTAALARK